MVALATPFGRTRTVTLGAIQAIPLPDFDFVNNVGGVDPVELWCTGSAAWSFQWAATDPAFPVAANTLVRIPHDLRSSPLLVAGSGTLTIAYFGPVRVSRV